MDAANLAFLKDEYLKLQDMYEDFDRRSLQIKGWMTAATVAGVALGADQSKNPTGTLWVVIAVMAACIWFLEGRWKMFQHALRDRIRILEANFRNDPDILEKNPQPFQIYHSWFVSSRHDKPIYPYEMKCRPRHFAVRLLLTLFHEFVCIPYLPIIAICLFAFFWPSHFVPAPLPLSIVN